MVRRQRPSPTSSAGELRDALLEACLGNSGRKGRLGFPRVSASQFPSKTDWLNQDGHLASLISLSGSDEIEPSTSINGLRRSSSDPLSLSLARREVLQERALQRVLSLVSLSAEAQARRHFAEIRRQDAAKLLSCLEEIKRRGGGLADLLAIQISRERVSTDNLQPSTGRPSSASSATGTRRPAWHRMCSSRPTSAARSGASASHSRPTAKGEDHSHHIRVHRKFNDIVARHLAPVVHDPRVRHSSEQGQCHNEQHDDPSADSSASDFSPPARPQPASSGHYATTMLRNPTPDLELASMLLTGSLSLSPSNASASAQRFGSGSGSRPGSPPIKRPSSPVQPCALDFEAGESCDMQSNATPPGGQADTIEASNQGVRIETSNQGGTTEMSNQGEAIEMLNEDDDVLIYVDEHASPRRASHHNTVTGEASFDAAHIQNLARASATQSSYGSLVFRGSSKSLLSWDRSASPSRSPSPGRSPHLLPDVCPQGKHEGRAVTPKSFSKLMEGAEHQMRVPHHRPESPTRVDGTPVHCPHKSFRRLLQRNYGANEFYWQGGTINAKAVKGRAKRPWRRKIYRPLQPSSADLEMNQQMLCLMPLPDTVANNGAHVQNIKMTPMNRRPLEVFQEKFKVDRAPRPLSRSPGRAVRLHSNRRQPQYYRKYFRSNDSHAVTPSSSTSRGSSPQPDHESLRVAFAAKSAGWSQINPKRTYTSTAHSVDDQNGLAADERKKLSKLHDLALQKLAVLSNTTLSSSMTDAETIARQSAQQSRVPPSIAGDSCADDDGNLEPSSSAQPASEASEQLQPDEVASPGCAVGHLEAGQAVTQKEEETNEAEEKLEPNKQDQPVEEAINDCPLPPPADLADSSAERAEASCSELAEVALPSVDAVPDAQIKVLDSQDAGYVLDTDQTAYAPMRGSFCLTGGAMRVKKGARPATAPPQQAQHAMRRGSKFKPAAPKATALGGRFPSKGHARVPAVSKGAASASQARAKPLDLRDLVSTSEVPPADQPAAALTGWHKRGDQQRRPQSGQRSLPQRGSTPSSEQAALEAVAVSADASPHQSAMSGIMATVTPKKPAVLPGSAVARGARRPHQKTGLL